MTTTTTTKTKKDAVTGAEVKTQGVKRKRPPTFPHLPADRAKKFKKAWVEKTKIKSKWKAQKRREDIEGYGRLEVPVYEDEDEDEDDAGQDREGPEDGDALEEGGGRGPTQPHVHPSRTHLHPKSKKRSREDAASSTTKKFKADATQPHHSSAKDKKPTDQDRSSSQPNLRDLFKEAYSKDSLHTFKSDPFKRRGRGSAVAGKGEKGRGQPNMKLRMNAMLEKIKQDLS